MKRSPKKLIAPALAFGLAMAIPASAGFAATGEGMVPGVPIRLAHMSSQSQGQVMPQGGMMGSGTMGQGQGGMGSGMMGQGQGGMGSGMMGQGQGGMGSGMMDQGQGGMGYGMMGRGQGGMGSGMGYGMMGRGRMGQGMMDQDGAGCGMSGQGQMGPGMMGPGMMGSGRMGMMGQAMPMGRFGPGGGYGFRVYKSQDLSTDDVRHYFEHRLERAGNKRLKLGDVKAVDDDSITVDVVTVDDSLVQRYSVDRHSGWAKPAQ